MNTMLYVRGAAEDYDSWAAAGCEGWSFEDVLPLFKRSEDNQRGESRFHGTGGPLRGRGPRGPGAALPLGRRRRRGRPPAQRGLQRRDPGRGRRLPGDPARRPPLQQLDRLHRPQSRAAEPDGADLHPGAARCSGSADRASGVEVDRFGEAEFIRAGREVIICGGAYLSPQLLMLSGDRPGRPPARDGDRAGPRQPRGRREPPGPPRLLPQLPGADRADGRGTAGSRPAASPGPRTCRCPTSSFTPPPAASPTRGSRPAGRRRSPSAPT